MKFIFVSLLLLAFSSCTSTHGHRHVASDHSHGDGEHHYHEAFVKAKKVPFDPLYCDLNRNRKIDDEEVREDNLRTVYKDCHLNKKQGLFSSSKLKRTAVGLKPGELVLTIDDGPNPYLTPRILDLLKQYNIKAMFFVTGNLVLRRQELIRRIIREGHMIGNHTYSHPLNLDSWSHKRTADDIIKAQGVIDKALGKKQEGRIFFRAPGLAWDKSGRAQYLNSLSETRKFIGHIDADIGLTAPRADWHCWGRVSSRTCSDYYYEDIQKAGRGIVLTHDLNSNSKKNNTYEMLRILLNDLDRRGGGITNYRGSGAWTFTTLQDNPYLDRLDLEKRKALPAGWKEFSNSKYRMRSLEVASYGVLDSRSLIKVRGGDLKTGSVIYYKFLGEYAEVLNKGKLLKMAKVKIMQTLPGLERFEGTEVYVGTGAL